MDEKGGDSGEKSKIKTKDPECTTIHLKKDPPFFNSCIFLTAPTMFALPTCTIFKFQGGSRGPQYCPRKQRKQWVEVEIHAPDVDTSAFQYKLSFFVL